MTHLTQKAAGDGAAEKLHFYYDAEGRPEMVDWNGTVYTYLHNVQGDVTGIVDNTGSIVVEYKYDAWGYPIGTSGSLTTTLGRLNPFRYRGYMYDEETGLYYLRSRYYNPNWGRFINADILLGKVGGLLSHNAWIYCFDNPISYADQNGRWPSFPEGSYKFDWAGIKILWWYLFGNGEDREVSGGLWTRYMKNSRMCSSCCGFSQETLSEHTYKMLRPYARGIAEGESRSIQIAEAVSLQNGESIYGYNYLHGTNEKAGGYVVSAEITRYCGYVSYNATCTWNDVMDPNLRYSSDASKAAFAESIPFANPTDYTISITWNDIFVENINGVSVPEY